MVVGYICSHTMGAFQYQLCRLSALLILSCCYLLCKATDLISKESQCGGVCVRVSHCISTTFVLFSLPTSVLSQDKRPCLGGGEVKSPVFRNFQILSINFMVKEKNQKTLLHLWLHDGTLWLASHALPVLASRKDDYQLSSSDLAHELAWLVM